MSYTGQFATNCNICTAKLPGPYSGLLSRSRHFARTGVASLQVAFPNWVINWFYGTPNFAEAGSGAIMTLTAAVEYAGVSTPFKWSGNTSVTIADGATSPLSDPLSVVIQQGDPFFIRSFYSLVSGDVILNTGSGISSSVSGANAANGEQCRSNTTDQTTATGNLTGGLQVDGLIYRPILLVATLPTDTKAFLIVGDSRNDGYRDVYTGISNDRGEMPRTVGGTFGYANCSVPGDNASNFIASHARRVALAAYFSHVICAYGINDIDGNTAAFVAAKLATLAGYFSIPVYQTTLGPVTDSTDAWATLVNQTPNASRVHRVELNNTYIRGGGIAGMAGFVEVADALESARDSGLWKVNGTANWFTDDTIHETNNANLAIQAALISNPLFTVASSTPVGSRVRRGRARAASERYRPRVSVPNVGFRQQDEQAGPVQDDQRIHDELIRPGRSKR